MIKEIKLSVLMGEIEEFINEFEDEFEFIVDINDVERWEVDFDNNCFSISECCSVFVRKEKDIKLEKWFKEDELVNKKVKVDDFILYIVM